MKVKFKDWDCVLTKYAYENGRTALCLNDATDGSPVAVATVNLPDVPLEDDKLVFIKDYSENEGMLQALVNAGVVEDTGLTVPSGYVEIPICLLKI